LDKTIKFDLNKKDMYNNLYYELRSLHYSLYKHAYNSNEFLDFKSYDALCSTIESIIAGIYRKIKKQYPLFKIECENVICIEKLDEELIQKEIQYFTDIIDEVGGTGLIEVKQQIELLISLLEDIKKRFSNS
jgi:hypothetical protein